MILKIFSIYFLVITLVVYFQKAHGKTYNAAVIEYHAVDAPGTSPDEKLLARAKDHIDLLKNVDQELEIIVYPEKSVIPDGYPAEISTYVPKKFDKIICNSTDQLSHDYLKLFSCAAIVYNTTIAINVIEKEISTASNSSVKYYNTVVVFNEEGYVSGRYRKWNLFGEYQLSDPEDLDITVIKTKNNISFGIITCFDINFSVPSLNLTRDLNISNIIFPNNWISELPYLTALQAQQMWSHENNVVLLASGGNNPNWGASGSGIFIGKNGPLETVFIGGEGGTKVIAQTVGELGNSDNLYRQSATADEDTDELANELDRFFLLRDLSMDDHTSVLMNENDTRTVRKVCNGEPVELCCNFDITIRINESAIGKYRYKYHLVTFDGIRSFSGVRWAGIEACGVVACLNDSLSSCGRRFSNYSQIVWPITFEKIEVRATFPVDENRAQYPNSLVSSLRPILPRYTTWEKEEFDNNLTRKHTLNKFENRLLTFGIFGRDFSRDSAVPQPSGGGSKNVEKMSVILLVLSLINIILFI